MLLLLARSSFDPTIVQLDCAADGGMFAGSYACIGGVSSVVPADLHIRGCPPRPLDLLKGLLALLQTAAAAFGQVPALWRLLVFTWSIVAAASMIVLMRELRIGLLAALCATALVIWNFRSGAFLDGRHPALCGQLQLPRIGPWAVR